VFLDAREAFLAALLVLMFFMVFCTCCLILAVPALMLRMVSGVFFSDFLLKRSTLCADESETSFIESDKDCVAY